MNKRSRTGAPLFALIGAGVTRDPLPRPAAGGLLTDKPSVKLSNFESSMRATGRHGRTAAPFLVSEPRDILGELRRPSCRLAPQFLCSLPKMKQPPGRRAERLLMSMSWTAIDPHDLRPNRTRRNRGKARIHTFLLDRRPPRCCAEAQRRLGHHERPAAGPVLRCDKISLRCRPGHLWVRPHSVPVLHSLRDGRYGAAIVGMPTSHDAGS